MPAYVWADRFKRANGSRNLSSHGVVENCNLLGHEYHDKVHDYYATYYPVEVDPHLTHAQKLPTMVEWWTKAHDALIEVEPAVLVVSVTQMVFKPCKTPSFVS